MTEGAPLAATPPVASRGKALAVLLLGACVIGLSPILVRLTETGPAAAGFWRLAFAMPILAIVTRRAAGSTHRYTNKSVGTASYSFISSD